MRHRHPDQAWRRAGVIMCLILVGALSGAPQAGAQSADLGPLEAPHDDPRSTLWLQSSCSNSLGRRDITLFANGTVRLREGLWEAQEVYLHELGPTERDVELEILARVFDQPMLSREQEPMGGVDGEWVEHCEVRLELPEQPPFRYRLGQFEVPPLEVSRLIQIAEDLAELTRPLDPVERLSPDYRPMPGDILFDAEEKRFVVIGLTADGGGVEVESLDEPLRIFHLLDELPRLFVSYKARGTL